MNRESPECYKLLFKRVFELVSEITGSSFQFHYLHGSGLKGIVLDMCGKQMTGKYYP